MSLRIETISALKWSLFGNILNQVTTFIIGILLARLLTPEEYGLIGMTTVFIVLADTFTDSGFSQALIRKNDCTNKDYATAFNFNIISSVLIYIILFLTAGFVADFFNEEKLTSIIRISSLGIIINALFIVHRTILIKNLNFKTQTTISITATVISGLVGLLLAYNGFGVWSLIFKSLAASIISVILFWVSNRWKPSFIFSKKSFDDLFSFGSKLLISNLIDRLYWNIYYIVIGKFFSAEILGYYTRAEMFKNLPSQNFTSVINNVAYTSLSKIQENDLILKNGFRRVLISTFFLTTFFIISLFSMSETLIKVLLGEKWLVTVEYMDPLLLSALLFSPSLLNTTIMKVKNKSNLILKLEPLKKMIALPAILLGIFISIKAMILFIIFNSIVDWLINTHYGGNLIKYTVKNQFIDLFPSLVICSIIPITLSGLNYLNIDNSLFRLIIQMMLCPMIVIIISELVKFEPYIYLKTLIINKLYHENF